MSRRDAQQEPLVDVDEVARLLKRSRISVYRLAAAGKIPSLKIGSHVRFDLGEIRAWVEQQRRKDTASLARRSRAAQGLPATIEDPATIARVCDLLASDGVSA